MVNLYHRGSRKAVSAGSVDVSKQLRPVVEQCAWTPASCVVLCGSVQGLCVALWSSV